MNRLLFLLAAAACAGLSSVFAADSLTVGDLKFAAPPGWSVAAQPKPMSQGGFVFAGTDGAPAVDAAFYHFGPGQGGDVEGNVKRWKGMFQNEPAPTLAREEIAFGSKKATLVTLNGTYVGSSFRPEPTPKPDHTLIAAVLPSEGGDVFVRMVGPSKAVVAARESFLKLLLSGAPADAK